MDFTHEAEFDALRVKTKAFIAEHVLPLEADSTHYDAHENITTCSGDSSPESKGSWIMGSASQQNAAGWVCLYEAGPLCMKRQIDLFSGLLF